MQASDWKKARRWRLAAVDSGTLSFADLAFKHSSSSSSSSDGDSSGSNDGSRRQVVLLPQQADSSNAHTAGSSSGGYVVTSVDRTRDVAGSVVLLTWPPDGRYSPLTSQQQPLQVVHSSSSSGSNDGSSGSSVPVRALVVPLASAGGSNGSVGE